MVTRAFKVIGALPAFNVFTLSMIVTLTGPVTAVNGFVSDFVVLATDVAVMVGAFAGAAGTEYGGT